MREKFFKLLNDGTIFALAVFLKLLSGLKKHHLNLNHLLVYPDFG